MTTPKQPFQDPTATVIGDVLSLTAGYEEFLSVIDKDFPAGTSFDDLTWS